MAPVITPAPYDLKNAISPNRMTGLWRMLTGYRWLYVAAIASLAVASLAKTSTYLLLRYYVDSILGKNAALATLAMVGLGFVLIALVEGAFTFLSVRLASRSAEGITLRLRTFLFDHIQRLSFSYHDKTQTGDLIQRSTSDVDAIRRFYADQAIGIGRIVLLFSINFWAIWRLDPGLALISVVVVPIIVVMSLFFFKRVSKAYEKYQEQEATLSTVLQENLSGVRVVKAFARQEYEREKFEKENWAKFLRGKRLLTMHALFWPTSDILCGLQMLLGFTVGALMAINGTITVGTYMAYAGLLVWLIFPMRNLGRLIVQTSTGMVSYGRVVEVISQAREPLTEGSHRPAGDVRGEIEFRGVSFQYQADTPVLQDLSFCVKPGQSVALLGATGSGKTSLVNLLPRFYEYTSGSLTLDGVELKEYPRDYLRHEIGIVEQEPFLFSRTIRENISYGVGRDGARRGSGSRRTRRGRPRCDPELPGRLQHAGRGEGRDVVGRAAAARGDRPHAAQRPAHPDPGRLHLVGGHRNRSRDPGRARRLDARTLDLHHRAPHPEPDERRPDPGAGERSDRPARHAR